MNPHVCTQYMCTHRHIYVYTHIYVHTYMYIHAHTYTYIHTRVCIHVHTHIYIYSSPLSRQDRDQWLRKHIWVPSSFWGLILVCAVTVARVRRQSRVLRRTLPPCPGPGPNLSSASTAAGCCTASLRPAGLFCLLHQALAPGAAGTQCVYAK